MKKTRTLKKLIAVMIAVILLFLILITALFVSSNRNIINSHIQAVGGATLNYYRSQLDAALERVSTYCATAVSDSLSGMEQYDTPMEQYLRTAEMGNTLHSLLNLSDDLLFAMVGRMNDPASVTLRSRSLSMPHSDALADILLSMANDGTPAVLSSQWTWLELDGEWYLTRFFLYGDGFCAVCVDSGVLAMADEREEGLYLFCRQNGIDIAGQTAVQEALASQPNAMDELRINGRTYSMLSTASTQGSFSIHCLVTTSASNLGRYLMQQTLVMLLFCFAMLFFLSALLKYTTGTFSTLNEACTQVSQGNLSTEITKEPRFAEEEQIYGAFNDMIDQIQDLRIDLYEQALYAQTSKLEFLRVQIKSHFFVNCLTVIHTLAMAGNTKLIEEFALCLADYFRYLGTGFSDTVPFGSELEHLNNFIKLHQIRYPGHIQYYHSCDPELETFEVLPMIPQTFVENVFKHAMGVTEDIVLTIRAYAADGGMWLEIRDNGPGFTQKQLSALNQPYSDTKAPELSGTGIANTKERLHLFYHDRSKVQFENAPEGGAVVRVFFPAVKERGTS